MAWRRRLCRYHAVGEDTPSRRPSSIAEIPCLVLVIRCIARNQRVSGSLVSAIWGIPFTPVSLGDSLGGWKTRKILPLGLITPGRFKRLTSGSAATLHAANISGACAGRAGSYARIAGGPASRG